MKGLNCGPCGYGHGCETRGPYLTAYDIARKHGFTGTEEEWIHSIGSFKIVRAAPSGDAFEADTALSDLYSALEHGTIPVLLTDRDLALLSGCGDDYLEFSSQLRREDGQDRYNVYIMGRRQNTVETRTVSGSGSGGEGWAPGTGDVKYMMLEQAIRESLEKADSAVQPEALEDYLPIDVFRDIEGPSASLIEVKRDPETGRLYVLVTGGSTPTADNTRLITMTQTGTVKTASMGANEIYNLTVEGPPVNLVLIDAAGRECLLTAKPMPGSGQFSPAKFATVDNADENIIIYSVYEQGIVSEAVISLDGTDYGSANSGKPLVVGADGKGTVGNWPVPGEGGEPVTWQDIVPPNGILQTDIARLTVEFTESNGVFSASANLTAVLAALTAHKAVDCTMGDYRGELIYAHADSEDTSEEFAIFKITEQVAVYQGQDGEERFPQVRMIYMTHVGATYQLEAIGGRCYVYVTESNGVYDVDTAATSGIARSVLGLLTAFYAGIETRMIVNDGYYNWSHPVSFHYGQAEIRFAGPEAVTVNGRTEIRMVEYTINSSSHVGRTVGSTLPVPASGEPSSPSTDQGKIPVVDTYGRFVLEAPEQELPEPQSGDSGKYLKLSAQNEPYWGSGPSGSGSSLPATSGADEGKGLFVDANGDIGWDNARQITITVNNSAASLNMSLAELVDALQAGRPAHVYAPGSGQTDVIEVYPTKVDLNNGTIILVGDTFDEKFSVTLVEVQGALIGAAVVAPSGNVRSPSAVTKTAAEMGTGFGVNRNFIYTVSDPISGFTITNASLPSMDPGMCIEIRLTVGSTAITTPTWPSWANLMNGWDGTFAASIYYDIIIDDAGNVYHSTREVSA